MGNHKFIEIVLLGSISDIFFEGSISDSDDAYGLSLCISRRGVIDSESLTSNTTREGII